MQDVKRLTLSQQQHLLTLIERANAAKLAIDTFIEYLRDEHAAPERERWMIKDIQAGFEQPEEQPA